MTLVENIATVTERDHVCDQGSVIIYGVRLPDGLLVEIGYRHDAKGWAQTIVDAINALPVAERKPKEPETPF